jgi:hypothetical protein
MQHSIHAGCLSQVKEFVATTAAVLDKLNGSFKIAPGRKEHKDVESDTQIEPNRTSFINYRNSSTMATTFSWRLQCTMVLIPLCVFGTPRNVLGYIMEDLIG